MTWNEFWAKVKAFFEKVWRWVRVDGLLHILAVYAIVLTFCGPVSWWVADLIAIGVFILKEVLDFITKKGTPEWHDIICDLAGLLLADGVIWLHWLFTLHS